MKRLIAMGMMFGAAFAPAAWSADWLGAGTTAGDATQVDVDDPLLWSTNAVPATGDSAVFNWPQSNEGYLLVGPGSSFNPSLTLELHNTAAPSGPKALLINKDLTLTGLVVSVPYNTIGGNSTTNGNYIDRIRFAQTLTSGLPAAGAGVTITLTGDTPFDFTNAAYSSLNTSMSSTALTTFKLTGSDIVLPQLSNTALRGGLAGENSGGIYGFNGGGPIENSTLTGNSQVRFEAVEGTVTIADAGTRTDGTMAIGFAQLYVRADQTWESSSTGFIRLGYRTGAGSAAPTLITSITGDALDNLGEVNLVVDSFQNSGSAPTDTTAMRIGAGTYGSIYYRGGGSRTTYLRLGGNVTFAGQAVVPGKFNNNGVGNVAATTIPYGFWLESGNGTNTANQAKRLQIAGNTLTTTYGILLQDNFGPTATTVQIASSHAILDAAASGSTVNIGGDLRFDSVAHDGTTASPVRGVGIAGGAGTIINLSGNFVSNVASITTAGYSQGLSTATLNLVGGSGLFKTYEVGDAASKALVANGYGVGTFNVGNGTTAGKVSLVNASINDNLAVDGLNTAAGEKLMVTNLNVKANSTLQINGLTTVIASGLSIDSTGTLDLASGLELQENDLIPFFVGTGDQTATWSTFAGRVMDGDSGATFAPTLSGGNTVWQVTSVPEPSGLAALATSAALLLRRRRR